MSTALSYLLPWQLSPTVAATCVLAIALYTRGLAVQRRAGARIGPWRPLSFFLGVALAYAVLQTYFDFLAQHMFWIHRLQHLVLHHVSPVLLVLSGPLPALRAGTPLALRRALDRIPLAARRPFVLAFRALQNPIVAPLLFVGLIYFWLTPSIHFDAMLDARRYELMNWSMLVDGVLFWWLMLAPRAEQGPSAIGYPVRFVILTAVAVLQIIIGAYITLVSTPLYSIYAVCGRAFLVSPMLDQQIGGLLTWVPAAMMSAVGALVVLGHLVRESEAKERGRAGSGAAAGPVPAQSGGRA
jgi:putative membrane protein